ncbi:MAG: hypothetical protein V1815_00205 [Candidatus Woesearchaeota archaeon]
MQKRLFFVIVALLLFSLSVSAVEVRLREPQDNIINTTSNKIVFKCIGVQIAGETLNSLTLRFKSGDVWYNMDTKPASDLQEVSFTYEIPANGIYKWNCLAKNNLNQSFLASNDYTLTLSKTNNLPVYPRNSNAYIQNVSWDKNTVKSNVFSLDYYFYDPDNDLLSYSVSGNLNIQVSIDPITHLVSFSQPNNWFGIEKIRFIANDGKSSTSSNEVTLTVFDSGGNQQQNQSSSNQKPQFTDVIPNQTKYKNGGSWTLDLLDYATDDKDNKDQLTWSISSLDTSLLEAIVNNVDKNIKFTPKEDEVGNDAITITVKDTSGLSASQEVTLSILEEVISEGSSNESDSSNIIAEENFPPDIENILPDNTNNLTLSEEQVFRVSVSDQEEDPLTISWYLDDNKIEDATRKEYVLDPSTLSNGTHKLKITVNDGKDSTSETWDVEYLAGNNIILETQNIENKTFLAASGEKITGGVAGFKNKITGNFVKVKDFIVKWKTPFIIGGGIILLIIIFLIIKLIIAKRSNNFMPKIKHDRIYTPKKIEDKTSIIPIKEESKDMFKRI